MGADLRKSAGHLPQFQKTGHCSWLLRQNRRGLYHHIGARRFRSVGCHDRCCNRSRHHRYLDRCRRNDDLRPEHCTAGPYHSRALICGGGRTLPLRSQGPLHSGNLACRKERNPDKDTQYLQPVAPRDHNKQRRRQEKQAPCNRHNARIGSFAHHGLRKRPHGSGRHIVQAFRGNGRQRYQHYFHLSGIIGVQHKFCRKV